MNTRSLRFRLVTWYALFLGAVFVVAGALLYFGLRGYLEKNLAATQTLRAQRIAALVLRTNITSDRELADEITTLFAPEVSGRFVRVVRPDQTIVYQSGPPQDQGFDPALISPTEARSGTRKETLGDGPELVMATVAAGPSSHPRFFVQTGESVAPALVELRRLLISLGLGLVVVAGMALAAGFLLVRRALRPVEEITHSAEQITSHSLSQRLPVPPQGNEFEHLSKSLNRMITRLDEAFQYNRRFLADASHELRTPLTVLRGELESLAQEERFGAEDQERLGSILEEVERLGHIVEGLFAIARLDAGEAQAQSARFDLVQLVTTTADQMMLLAEDKGIEIACGATEAVWVEGDRARLKQVVVNLLDNAIKYTRENGRIILTAKAVEGQAVLEVADNGIGIPFEDLPHVFDRFFRVDKARSRDLGGAGIGLSIVKAICTAHGGEVKAESLPDMAVYFE